MLMLWILLSAELSLSATVEAVGPRGFLARMGSISLWMADFSDSSFLTVQADFCGTGTGFNTKTFLKKFLSVPVHLLPERNDS